MHLFILNTKNSRVGVFYRIAVLKTLAKLKKKHIFNGVVVEKLQVQTCNFTKNRTLQQVLPSGFYIIFQTRLFKEHLQMTAFEGKYSVENLLKVACVVNIKLGFKDLLTH